MGIEALYSTSELHPNDLLGILIAQTKMFGLINNYPIRRKTVPYESIDLIAQNDRTFVVYVKTEELDVVNITGATGILTISETKGASPVITKSTAIAGQGQIGAGNKGEMYFYIVPADTTNLAARQYVFDVTITLSTGKKYTVLEGVINLSLP
jgi:hypothetical protein